MISLRALSPSLARRFTEGELAAHPHLLHRMARLQNGVARRGLERCLYLNTPPRPVLPTRDLPQESRFTETALTW